MKALKWFFLIGIISVLLTSCTPMASTLVSVSRDRYQPEIIMPELREYGGRTMIFYSIVIEAKNIDNFSYYSPDRKIGYVLYYTPTHMQQPVASYFWYTLEKAFHKLGISVREGGPLKNVPELLITLKSLTDQEAVMMVSLSRNGYLMVQKDITVSMPMPPTHDVKELENRSYLLMDKIAASILLDPDVKREFFSDRAKIK